jgi:hypothetical protein
MKIDVAQGIEDKDGETITAPDVNWELIAKTVVQATDFEVTRFKDLIAEHESKEPWNVRDLVFHVLNSPGKDGAYEFDQKKAFAILLKVMGAGDAGVDLDLDERQMVAKAAWKRLSTWAAGQLGLIMDPPEPEKNGAAQGDIDPSGVGAEAGAASAG